MQSDHKQIYKLTAERTAKNEQLYKDIGNFVFTELYNMLRKPKSLIIKLRGVGSWRLIKKRMDITIKEYPQLIREATREDFPSDIEHQIYLNKKEMYMLFQERLVEYEEYIKLRKEIKIKRDEGIVLLESDNGEDKSP
jgi:hypothetical protein